MLFYLFFLLLLLLKNIRETCVLMGSFGKYIFWEPNFLKSENQFLIEKLYHFYALWVGYIFYTKIAFFFSSLNHQLPLPLVKLADRCHHRPPLTPRFPKKIHPLFDFPENSSSFDFRKNPCKTPKEIQNNCFFFAFCVFWICSRGLFVVVPLDLNFTNSKSTIFESGWKTQPLSVGRWEVWVVAGDDVDRPVSREGEADGGYGKKKKRKRKRKRQSRYKKCSRLRVHKKDIIFQLKTGFQIL